MRLTPTPTGNSFFDAPSNDQSEVTLILGGERLECHLVEVSLGGFGVTVPRSTAWTGEPICRLLTHDAAYPVRIIRQEAQYTGFLLTLQRIQEQDIPSVESPGVAPRWIVNASRCCAVGLIAAIAYCFLAAPGGSSSGARTFHPQDVAKLWNGTWSASTSGPSNRGPAARKTGPDATTSAHDDSTDGLFELPAISVSLGSSDPSANAVAASAPSKPVTSSRANGPADIDLQARVVAAATRKAQIKSSLLTALRGASWPADSTTLPWLFPANDPTLNGGPAYRLSEAARADLSLFESGLKSLPAQAASDATRSLRRALAATATAVNVTSPPASLPFDSLPNVRLVRSEDAEIYFRPASGLIDILRVVPPDGLEPDAARPNSPTSSLPPQSVNR